MAGGVAGAPGAAVRARRSVRGLRWLLPLVAAGAVGGWLLAPPSVAATVGSRLDPKVVYHQDCASCHGENGRGTSRGPDLRGVGMAAVDFQLTTGRMPKRTEGPKPAPYKPILRPAVIDALDHYVTALVAKGGPPIPNVDPTKGDVGQGGELFRVQCAACHGWNGSGGELNDRPIPALHEATPTQIGEAVRTGPTAMPIFGTRALSPTQVDSIVAYLQAMQRPDDRGGDPLSHLGPVSEGAVTFLIGLVAILGVIRWIGKRG